LVCDEQRRSKNNEHAEQKGYAGKKARDRVAEKDAQEQQQNKGIADDVGAGVNPPRDFGRFRKMKIFCKGRPGAPAIGLLPFNRSALLVLAHDHIGFSGCKVAVVLTNNQRNALGAIFLLTLRTGNVATEEHGWTSKQGF